MRSNFKSRPVKGDVPIPIGTEGFKQNNVSLSSRGDLPADAKASAFAGGCPISIGTEGFRSKTGNKVLETFSIGFLFAIIVFNFFVFYKNPDIFTKSKIQMASFNKGDSYSGRLNFWRLLVQNNDWLEASKLEDNLNQTETVDYKFQNQPDQIKQRISLINQKSSKTTEDYLQLAKLYSLINQPDNSFESIKIARQLDPIRDDIDRLYYSLSK